MRRKRPTLFEEQFVLEGKKAKLSFKISSVHKRQKPLDLLSPIHFLSMLHFKCYNVHLHVHYDNDEKERFELTSNKFGRVNTTIHLSHDLKRIELFAELPRENIQYYLGEYWRKDFLMGKHLIISDFDKTLIQTSYGSLKEVFFSLTHPLSSFRTIRDTLKIINNPSGYEKKLIILSASPHFYYHAIRQWLLRKTEANFSIILKDYREFFSDGNLTTKDLSRQGFYKLSQLLDLLIMNPDAQKITLLGDSAESDAIIYLQFIKLLKSDSSQKLYHLMQETKNSGHFLLTIKQHALIKKKILHLHSSLSGNEESLPVEIFIKKQKKSVNEISSDLPKNCSFHYLKSE